MELSPSCIEQHKNRKIIVTFQFPIRGNFIGPGQAQIQQTPEKSIPEKTKTGVATLVPVGINDFLFVERGFAFTSSSKLHYSPFFKNQFTVLGAAIGSEEKCPYDIPERDCIWRECIVTVPKKTFYTESSKPGLPKLRTKCDEKFQLEATGILILGEDIWVLDEQMYNSPIRVPKGEKMCIQ
ncbi:MAG: hypothetical protein Satyrvirus15_12 [Satyrvirus sp.]|uniref:Uncharacterized protein n=1 Tax=Satyrvirus sp. TaxID=2487771 RepID=A0A3G5ADW8_9VIRU|nr:MAG: hypothetical protein Satyrvirus15_12 [Satyrvirus sp.]